MTVRYTCCHEIAGGKQGQAPDSSLVPKECVLAGPASKNLLSMHFAAIACLPCRTPSLICLQPAAQKGLSPTLLKEGKPSLHPKYHAQYPGICMATKSNPLHLQTGKVHEHHKLKGKSRLDHRNARRIDIYHTWLAAASWFKERQCLHVALTVQRSLGPNRSNMLCSNPAGSIVTLASSSIVRSALSILIEARMRYSGIFWELLKENSLLLQEFRVSLL